MSKIHLTTVVALSVLCLGILFSLLIWASEAYTELIRFIILNY